MLAANTESVPPRERAEFWADLVSRHVTPIRIEPAGAGALRGEIEARACGDFGIARVAGAGVHAAHTHAHVARANAHLHCVCVNLAGEARITRRGETVALQPGDVFVTDSRQEFAFDLDRPWRHLVIALPTEWLDGRIARPETLAGAVFRDRPLTRLLAAHLAAGHTHAGNLSPSAAALFARHSLELIVQLVGECRTENAGAAAVREAAFAYACRVIALRFADPDLTPAQVAKAVGVSTRTLSRAFAERGETVMRRVMDERVSHAAQLLAAPAAAARSVTDIAFRCGFKDLSHFGRVFADKMQTTPSQWRRRAHQS